MQMCNRHSKSRALHLLSTLSWPLPRPNAQESANKWYRSVVAEPSTWGLRARIDRERRRQSWLQQSTQLQISTRRSSASWRSGCSTKGMHAQAACFRGSMLGEGTQTGVRVRAESKHARKVRARMQSHAAASSARAWRQGGRVATRARQRKGPCLWLLGSTRTPSSTGPQLGHHSRKMERV